MHIEIFIEYRRADNNELENYTRTIRIETLDRIVGLLAECNETVFGGMFK